MRSKHLAGCGAYHRSTHGGGTIARSRPQPSRSHFVRSLCSSATPQPKQTDLPCCPKRECVQDHFRSFKTAEDLGPDASFRTWKKISTTVSFRHVRGECRASVGAVPLHPTVTDRPP